MKNKRYRALVACLSVCCMIFAGCGNKSTEAEKDGIRIVVNEGGQTLGYSTVEEQFEDVPHDMACHVDSEGNAYDFGFGLNWSGVIHDVRVATYSKSSIH